MYGQRETMTLAKDLRRRSLMVITRRLIIFSACALIVISVVLTISYIWKKRVMLSYLTFGCGLLGGFVSIQQRLHKIDEQELSLLTESWFTILVIPIFGAIFAEVLYVLFLSGLLKGHMFPLFYIPPFGDAPTASNIVSFLHETYPRSGEDMAKLMFWAFVAGFSERFVPQIVSRISSRVEDAEDVSTNESNEIDENSGLFSTKEPTAIKMAPEQPVDTNGKDTTVQL